MNMHIKALLIGIGVLSAIAVVVGVLLYVISHWGDVVGPILIGMLLTGVAYCFGTLFVDDFHI